MENFLRTEFTNTYFSQVSSTKGVETLSKKIGISKNSLRRFLGKLNDGTKLRISTLNFISESLGYSDFKDFCDNVENKEDLIDFSALKIFYGSIKGKGVITGEERFQNVNYEFAEKIILNNNNLKSFIKEFAENHEALEYVLAWYPTYGKIADKDYQNALLKMSKISNDSHLKVYANSFVFFGIFLSEKWNYEEAEKFLKNLRKNVKQMREDYIFFWTFPEIRYRICECLHAFMSIEKTSPNYLLNMTVKSVGFYNYPNISKSQQFIYNVYLADALNLIGHYEDAHYLHETSVDEKLYEDLENEDYHSRTHIIFSKISRAVTWFKLNEIEESKTLFSALTKEISENPILPFDMKDYFEIQYYYLATKFYPENVSFQQRFDKIIKKTNFTFFRNF